MKKITWQLNYNSLPSALRYCKKCGAKAEFLCSEQFRVNAQRKYLDIWLIYKCSSCDTTWNASVSSRISPQSLPSSLLEGFLGNDRELAGKYAADPVFLQKNGAEMRLPAYTVCGDSFLPDEDVELEIKSRYPLPVRVSSIVRNKLGLSQKEYAGLIAAGILTGTAGQDLLKCRLNCSHSKSGSFFLTFISRPAPLPSSQISFPKEFHV